MTKSFFEKELEKDEEYCLYTRSRDSMLVERALQKTKEELKNKRECRMSYPHICSKHPEDCEYYLLWSDFEEVFGK